MIVLGKNKSSSTTIIIIVIAAVVLLLISGFVVLAGAVFLKALGAEAGEKVAVIYLNGTIEESDGGYFSAAVSPNFVRTQLERAAAGDAIKGVVLRVNSPGGSVAASQEIASLIREFPKPVVVSMGDMAASGGYYISAPAQGIVAQPGTMTGSIGVITQVTSLEGLYEMLGIEVETIKSGRHKDMFGRVLTPEERELLQELTDEAYEQFIAEVAQGRGLDRELVRDLATGQLYTGSQALELGLVDRLGGLEEAIAYLSEIAGLKNPVRYEFPQPSLFTQLTRYGLKIPELFRETLPPELLLLDRYRLPFEVRYELK